MARSRRLCLIAASLLAVCFASVGQAGADGPQVNTIKEMFARLRGCWKPPSLPRGEPGMQITVLVSFKRNGEILGKPRITFESAASDADRIVYRTAIMKTLQRCVPMPFTESMGGAIAGRLLTFRFDDRRNLPKPTEKRAWLTTTTL